MLAFSSAFQGKLRVIPYNSDTSDIKDRFNYDVG